MELTAFLRRVPLFDCLGDGELEALAELTITRTFDKGQLIILADEPGDTLFIVRRGQVKVSLTHASGKEFILSLLGEGEFFGELAILDERPRSASVVAMEETDLIMLTRPDFLQLVGRVPAIAVALLEELAARLRRTDEQVGGLALLDVHNRVARIILRLAADRGEETDEGIRIKQRLTHQQLANMAGTTRETVTRVLKQLERDGYITTRDRQIVVRRDGGSLEDDGLPLAGVEEE
jgi:CRP/FNR family transcriptional regulator/CRP/FNR family cyclic AMP-dependent transcriptional regulator